MGQTHLRALGASERVEVVAITETSDATRASLKVPAGISVHADVDQMLKAGGLDGVLIAVPSTHHVNMVARLAVAGISILCEKPCGITAREARVASEIAAKEGVLLQVAYWRRFVPALKRLKDRIAQGELGDLYLVSCYQWDELPPSAAFRATSGGAFIDMGVHEFDQMRWLTGQEFVHLRVATATTAFAERVEADPDAAQALCDLSRGTSGLVSLGRRFAEGDACWAQVFGTKGFEDCRFFWPPEGEKVFLSALRLQAEGFADAVCGKPSEGATAADAIAALTAAEQATAALSKRRTT
jgi:myo-inositol 2-dehydrogenase/D-chiro-inositol 1-dehydrogenase